MPKEIDPSIWEKTGPCMGDSKENRCTNTAKLYEISEQNGETFHTYLCKTCEAEYENFIDQQNRIAGHACGATA